VRFDKDMLDDIQQACFQQLFKHWLNLMKSLFSKAETPIQKI
jgi:hypothetical protein